MLSHLSPEGDWLRCLGCGQRHPVVDGLPLVLRAGLELQAEPELDAQLVELMRASSSGPLHAWLTQTITSLAGQVLDLGCGVQAWGRSDVVGLDLRAGLLRARGGVGVIADAADPPFPPESFDAVLLVNLLDCVPNPQLVLAQADALLRPGGVLLISLPFAWDPVVPLERRFEWGTLRAALEGDRNALGMRFGYTLLQEHTLEWPIQRSDGSRARLSTHTLLARKAAAHSTLAPGPAGGA